MAQKSISLAVQLLLALVGLVVITTLVLTTNAYQSFRLELDSDARRMVRASAEQSALTLTRLVEQQQERAQEFLNSVHSLCGETVPGGRVALESGCVRLALSALRETEHARGARFEYRHRVVAVGDPPRPDLVVPGPFARIVWNQPGLDYVFTVSSDDSRLTVQHSIEQLDVLFRNHPVSGGSGEVILTDTDGHFLTTPRYTRTTLPAATAVEPVYDCMKGASELTALDYRGIKTIHGLRPVSVFFGGACVDAHLGYDEVLAPSNTLLRQLVNRSAVFALIGVILSLVASRWIAGPVRRLALSAQALGEGNFDRPIPIAGPSEIRALGRGFATMARAMADLALHDVLTNLPNRRLLKERLSQAIEVTRRHRTQLAVLFLDLDGFKRVNDSLGHETGDRLLQSVAGRLLRSTRRSDTVGRQGGDEFVLVLSDIGQIKDAARSAEKLIDALTAAHDVDGQALQITASIGISVYPDDGQDPETLLKHADTAMYHAKGRGRSTYQFFDPAMTTGAVDRERMRYDPRGGWARREFPGHGQAKTDPSRSAWVRWLRRGVLGLAAMSTVGWIWRRRSGETGKEKSAARQPDP